MGNPKFLPGHLSDVDNAQILNRIFMIAERMIVFDGLDDVFEHIVKTAVTLTHADAATIRVFDFNTGTLNIVKGYGVTNGFMSQPPVRVGEGVTGTVVQTGRPYSSSNVLSEPLVKNADFARLEGIRSVLCVPMNTRENTIGCITVYRKSGQNFADHDLLLLSIFASEAVEAVEKARLIGELQAQATFDSLTGLYNKRSLLQKLGVEVARSQRHKQPLSVLFMDLDDFKGYNDTHGHLMGDKLIHDFTRLVREHCRKMDLIGRFGGDEFVIVAPQTDGTGALALAEKVQQAIHQHTFISSRVDEFYRTTCSIGIAAFPEQSSDAEQLLERADRALFASKRRGKGCASLWKPET